MRAYIHVPGACPVWCVQVEPTLIYALTVAAVEEAAAYLNSQPGLAGRVGVYHAKRSVEQRRQVHEAFLRDDLVVVVATVAYGA